MAKRAIARRRKWQPWLNWVSYFSLPTGIAEALTGAPSVAGTTLSVTGVTDTAVTARTERCHGWILFNV